MSVFFTMLLLLAQATPPGLEQIRADPSPEHRARLAIDFAGMSERNAEAAYSRGDLPAVAIELKNMQAAIELAQQAFVQSGKSPQRHPGPYKVAELRTQEILVRLGDLQRRMDDEERALVEGPKAKVQEIHDAWFDGIMGKKK
jgi:hypothetical protein